MKVAAKGIGMRQGRVGVSCMATKTEIKRRVYRVASRILSEAARSGWESEASILGVEDILRWQQAMDELIEELAKRGKVNG